MVKKASSVILIFIILTGIILTSSSCDLGDFSMDKIFSGGSVGDVVGDVTGKPILTEEQMKVIPYVGANGNWWIDEIDTGICAVGQDGITPHIGENNNWWIGDTDTGVCAVGKDGETPTVGYNGNWWLGNKDTGISAKGPKGDKGEDGLTPYIGENGNWWIGKTDTGVKAGCDCCKDDDPTDPDSPIDYRGRVIHIANLGSALYSDEITVESINGCIVNDAIYKRNASVETRLNIKLSETRITGNSNSAIVDSLRTLIYSGNHEYDLVNSPVGASVIYATDGIFTDLNDIESLDLNEAWWSYEINDSMSIHDAQYMVTGAANLSLYRLTYATFVNDTIIESDPDFPDLLEVVDDGKWTIEYQSNLAKRYYTDMGAVGKDELDCFGLITNNLSVDPYWSSCEIPILRKTDDNYYSYALDKAKLLDVADQVGGLFLQDAVFYYSDTSVKLSEKFAQGNSAMATLRLMDADTLRSNLNDEYSILPIPKYSEDQENYYSFSSNNFTGYGIPSTAPAVDLQMLGCVLEVITSESYKTVIPAYRESVLSRSYAANLELFDMLDMITTDIKIDAGVLLSSTVGNVHAKFRTIIGDMVLKGKGNTVSNTYNESYEEQVKEMLDLWQTEMKNAVTES